MGWPDHQNSCPPSVKPFWNFTDEFFAMERDRQSVLEKDDQCQVQMISARDRQSVLGTGNQC